MSELENQSVESSYLKILKTTEVIEPPAIGFAVPSQYKTSFEYQRVLVKQNNTIISFLIDIYKQVQDLRNQINQLKGQASTQAAGPSKELEGAIDDLTKRIAGINLAEGSVIPKKKGSILVFKNPADILNNEKLK